MYTGNDPQSRRNIFEKYAAANNFDPLMAHNWYTESLHKLKQIKVVVYF